MSADSVEELKQYYVDSYTDERNKTIEKVTIGDSWITNSKEAIFIKFININQVFPDSDNVTVEDMLDINREYLKNLFDEYKAVPEWSGRTTVKLGNNEYLRDVVTTIDVPTKS